MWPTTSWVHYTTSCNTQSSAPEDGQNNCTKRVELTEIINKPLLLHLFDCLYYLYFIIFFWDLLNSLNLFLYRMSWILYRYVFWFVKYSHFTIMMCCYLNVQLQGQRVHFATVRIQLLIWFAFPMSSFYPPTYLTFFFCVLFVLISLYIVFQANALHFLMTFNL